MNVLIACEESQTVCAAFRKLGFNAYSCDLVECSGGHPEWHLLGDALTETKSAEERRRLRSKTFQGMANAMAKQWGDFLLQQEIKHEKTN